MVLHRSGSVRSAAAREAILTSTAALILERGYDHLTMEGIAAHAGVGKQTIYRWWRTRSALVADCLLEGMLLPESFEPPRGGDIHADLVRWLTEIFALADAPEGQGLLRSLIAAAAELEPFEQIGEALIGGVILRVLSRKPTDADVIDSLVTIAIGSAARLRKADA